MPQLQAWANFYVIVGSAAAALTGLQFLVITLGAQANVLSQPAVRAFGTPTIVHFCSTLFLSAVLAAPWHVPWHASVCLALFAIAGLGYTLRGAHHVRIQTDYKPVAEDWLWFFIGPAGVYVVLLLAAALLPRFPATALFLAAGTALLLLFVGIHNAWDSVTYIAVNRSQEKRE